MYSLSNYSSDGNYSNKSSLNDSGVVGDQELDNVSVGHRDLQRYQVGVVCILRNVSILSSAIFHRMQKSSNIQLILTLLQESLDNPNGAAGGDIINCENGKDGNGRNSGDPLVIDIGN